MSTKLDIARITLEATTPFRVGIGERDDLHDSVFATDANGLPTLPGSSLAGVLRHAWEARHGETATNALFGYQRGGRGAASKVEVSWGQVHGADDRPVPFLGATTADDEVLGFLTAGVSRDHVALSTRGAALARRKYDELLVPAGARFTFELVVRDAEVGVDDLVALLASPLFRLGARTRSGVGSFRVVRAGRARFDLTRRDGLAALTRLPRRLDAVVPDGVLEPLEARPARLPDGVHAARVTLRPEDYWQVGRGDPFRPSHRRPGTEDRWSDHVPVEQRRILWDGVGGRGRVQSRDEAEPFVPGSALKGALRHRAEFHLRRRRGKWCDPDTRAPDTFVGEDRALADEVFGAIVEAEDTGRPGRVFVSDGTVHDAAPGWLDHVSLDRFTQGPMDRLLFDEAPLYKGRIELQLIVDGRASGGRDDDPSQALAALGDALRDLVEGRLAIGAAGNRGHGYCKGRVEWSEAPAWWKEGA